MNAIDRRLRGWRVRHEIRGLLVDLDDTLIATEPVFVEHFAACVDLLVEHRADLDRGWLAARLRAMNIESFQRMAANLERRWPWVVRRLVAELALDRPELERRLVAVLGGIASSLPPAQPGAHDMLRAFRRAGFTSAIVTHADRAWTERKLGALGLDALVDSVHVVDQDSFKTAASWSGAMAKLDIAPWEALVIGDSLGSDICAAYEADVRRLVWVHAHDGWEYARRGTVPDGTLVVADISQVIDALVPSEPPGGLPGVRA